jgi:hypothetical protein
MAATFATTYGQFLTELKWTFPEHAATLTAAEACTAADFGALWSRHTSTVATQDASIFTVAGIPLVKGFLMTSSLWTELSVATQAAIWKYLSSLLLLYTAETNEEGMDLSGFKADLDAMMKRLAESKDLSGAEGFGLLGEEERLKSMLPANDVPLSPLEPRRVPPPAGSERREHQIAIAHLRVAIAVNLHGDLSL